MLLSSADGAKNLEDAFVRVSFDDERLQGDDKQSGQEMYKKYIEHSSAKTESTGAVTAEALRKLHPDSSLVFTKDVRIDLMGYPQAAVAPMPDIRKLSEVTFIPLARRLQTPGLLADRVQFGVFRVTWKEHEFLLYVISWTEGAFATPQTLQVLVHDQPDDTNARQLFLDAALWSQQLHNEIWVFDRGFWTKDQKLWEEVQKADWKDVILKNEFKVALQQDVNGFFASEKVYKELGVPWKRGLIMYGPPGNGKTISLKAIMKDAGYPSLYVRSFQSYLGEEGSMRVVFEKAREYSPCIVILEDLDALINDKNRSFFLNQLDGLDNNDGLLVIGTTNHFDRLDGGLSNRPSRFDRKYLFADPDKEERVLYGKYWQEKLKDNKDIAFPDSLVQEIADLTDGFSFSYLKEAFVATLILLAGDKETSTFEKVIKEQIRSLRKQLNKKDLVTAPVFSDLSSSRLKQLFL